MPEVAEGDYSRHGVGNLEDHYPQFFLWPQHTCLYAFIVLFQIMTGNSILKDGRSVLEMYGIDLDELKEGERIGVMRTAEVTDYNHRQ
jgi:hypothetical protein